jgi:hypothetical protein
MFAHIFKSAAGWVLILSTDARPIGSESYHATKTCAKRLAKKVGAKPWNY